MSRIGTATIAPSNAPIGAHCCSGERRRLRTYQQQVAERRGDQQQKDAADADSHPATNAHGAPNPAATTMIGTVLASTRNPNPIATTST